MNVRGGGGGSSNTPLPETSSSARGSAGPSSVGGTYAGLAVCTFISPGRETSGCGGNSERLIM